MVLRHRCQTAVGFDQTETVGKQTYFDKKYKEMVFCMILPRFIVWKQTVRSGRTSPSPTLHPALSGLKKKN
jgi:hypothetical protein